MTDSRKCSRETCKAWAIRGGTVCVKHGGSRPAVKANAAIRSEVLRWTLGDSVDDPGETLLRLITQSRLRADAYANELDRLVAESPDLRAVLVGDVYVATDDDSYKAGEYIRGMAQLEAQERDRLAGFCVKAIAAGLAERVVRVQESQAAQVAEVIRIALDEAGLDEEQRRRVVAQIGRSLRAVAS